MNDLPNQRLADPVLVSQGILRFSGGCFPTNVTDLLRRDLCLPFSDCVLSVMHDFASARSLGQRPPHHLAFECPLV